MTDFLEELTGLYERLTDGATEEGTERRAFGIVTGRVDRIRDDNSYEVTYFGMSDEDLPSLPARAMAPMAGSGRGAYFMPLPGDEVVVAFEDGDTNHPIILGCLWNDSSQPPSQANESPDNDFRTVVSRSGHELTFDDRQGRGKITLKINNGHSVELDEQLQTISLVSRAGNRIVIDDKTSTITLLCGQAQMAISGQTGQVTTTAPNTMSFNAQRIELNAPLGIGLNTTGTLQTTLVTVEGRPFQSHIHAAGTLPTGTTGPVAGP